MFTHIFKFLPKCTLFRAKKSAFLKVEFIVVKSNNYWGFDMGAKYDLLKLATVAGTVFSVYNAFTDRLLLEDLLIVILAAVWLIAITRDYSKVKNRNEEIAVTNAQKDLANAQQDIATAQKDLAKVIEETIKKELAGN